MMQGRPKQGQTLDEVKDLLLNEIKKLRNGDFDEKILQANINNFKLQQLRQLEDNDGRADWFVQSFVNGSNWADEVTALDRMSKLTKAEIVAFANKFLQDNNFALIYKRKGQDPNEKKISKPTITPIVMNRDAVSPFLKGIQDSKVQPIQPVFLDYNKDLTKLNAKSNIPVLYKQNTSNDLFQLIYLFDMGNNNDKALGTAADYLEYLGTSDMTPEQVKSEFYRLAWGMNTGRKGNNVWCLSPMFDLKKPTILLNSHIDTVKPVNGWRKDPFNPQEENGKLYGLGSNDAGASVVSLLQVFFQLCRSTQSYNLIYLAS